MGIEDMINFMLAHEDVYAAVDSKLSPSEIYSALVEAARTLNAESILERIIVSLYETKDVETVKGIYPFRHFVMRQYARGYSEHNWYELAEFCIENNIHVVNVWDTVADSDIEGIRILLSHSINVWAAVVNSLGRMQRYKDLGITGAVSAFLYESDWKLLE